LEELEPGTPVRIAEQRVGEVRGVYAEGEARVAEYLAVHWDSRGADILIPTRDVEALDNAGVILMGDRRSYETTAVFDPANLPMVRRLR
jgi:hypothetical protein